MTIWCVRHHRLIWSWYRPTKRDRCCISEKNLTIQEQDQKNQGKQGEKRVRLARLFLIKYLKWLHPTSWNRSKVCYLTSFVCLIPSVFLSKGWKIRTAPRSLALSSLPYFWSERDHPVRVCTVVGLLKNWNSCVGWACNGLAELAYPFDCQRQYWFCIRCDIDTPSMFLLLK